YSGAAGNNAQIDLYGPTDSPTALVIIGLYPGGTIGGHGITEFTIQLDNPTAPGMTPYLTAAPPIVGNYSGRALNIFLDLGAYTISGEMTAITLAPEPSSLVMMFGGAFILGKCLRARRRVC